ncbi:MAG: calcium/sodium antiporter [Planctomycetes bacterium]|nr:calcium/sodium antiporter [Planctomycetota bacterium]MBU1518460.1 calcium/sodium antiporter [Planctomycetota bacterium]MBU2458022.1 calcium/sodium antiporter [Planctomycetota bacterium]MBU2596497.1 calcium/sodium antiporter [Planctomycetota bacterium]
MAYFLPDQWFEFLAAKGVFWIFCSLAVSFIALFKGSDWFVDGAAGAAKKLGIPVIIIGVTIVSLGTTSPEATVSIMAAFAGKSDLALGNAIGSIICNTALIFGMGCALAKIPTDRFIFKRQGMVKLLSCMGFILLCYILLIFHHPYVSRLYGFILLGILVWYIFASVKWAKQHRQPGIIDAKDIHAQKSLLVLGLVFLAGLILVIVASRVLIASATQICLRFGVPEAVIASTIVAFGTSVPELATGVASLVKGHKEILLGNIIGANILNIFVVIGGSISVAGLHISPDFYRLHFPFFVLVVGLFIIFSAVSKKYYNRIFGPIFLLIYAAYVAIQYLVK